MSNGGVRGICDLLAHHLVGIISELGMVDPSHYLNTPFSGDSGTASFIFQRHGLKVARNKHIIDVAAGRIESHFGQRYT